jgi:exopolysaccharide biosynthesis protein
MTTFTHQYIAKTFLSQSTIDKIMSENVIDDKNKKTDVTAITIPDSVKSTVSSNPKDGIVYTNVSTSKCKAYLLEIADPSRISIGTSDNLGKNGMKLADIVDKYGAIAAINAGGFEDINGQGNGGTPEGTLVENGVVLFGNENERYQIIGLNDKNDLVLGYFNKVEMKAAKIRDAACFGPFLIVNGEALIKSGNGGGGLQPRTLIAQKQNGTIMFLVMDGRQVSSVGATLKQAQDILLEHGAYNAANLDGGASSQIVFNGQTLNHPCSIYGPRNIPSAFIVR